MTNYNFFRFHDFIQGSVETIVDKIGVPQTVIEVGVFYGHFTFNMVESTALNNSSYKHYAIDPYGYSYDLENADIKKAYEAFTHNLAICPYNSQIEFMRQTSTDALLTLLYRKIKADLIYIDGDHRASGVLKDLVFSWELLRVGGAILCDDSQTWVYTDKNKEKPLQMSPKMAVDAFIHCNWDKLEPIILPNGYQTAFIKRAD
jgi:cephalosporin hydroxylase